MAFKPIRKERMLMRFISLQLMFLVPAMGFPIAHGASSRGADFSRTANIVNRHGKRLTIDKGVVDGVRVGMTGLFRFTGGSGQYKTSGLFVVKRVYTSRALVEVKNALPSGTDLSRAVGVLFREPLIPGAARDFPPAIRKGPSTTIEVKPKGDQEQEGAVKPNTATAGKNTSVEYYMNYQTVNYTGNDRYHSVFSYVTAIEKKDLPKRGRAEYKLWTKGQCIRNSEKEPLKFRFGPHQLHRDLESDRIDIISKGYTYSQEALDEAMRQIKKGRLSEGYWSKRISLTSLGLFFPPGVTFHFKASLHDCGTREPVYTIKCISELFTFKTIVEKREGEEKNGDIAVAGGKFTGFAVYSPHNDKMYQVTSVFEALLNKEWMRIEECGYLVDKKGEAVFKLLDFRRELNLSETPDHLGEGEPTTLPLWAVQAAKVQRAVCLSGLAVAGRGKNPGPAAVLPGCAMIGFMSTKNFLSDHETVISHVLTADYITGGMSENEARLRARVKMNVYIPTPETDSAIFSDEMAGYFSELLKQLFEISMTFSIGKFIAQAADSLYSNENLQVLEYAESKIYENVPPIVGKMENNTIRTLPRQWVDRY